VKPLDAGTAGRFARRALDCIHREYPNKIAHVLTSDADARPPRRLTPAFYGCYDWHSAVHAHWTLARLANRFPDAPFTPAARAALAHSLTPENLRAEAEYVGAPERIAFERPYGLAWLLQLAAETGGLDPLEDVVVRRVSQWLPKLSHPVRSGEHSNTAFALGLMLDYARVAGRPDFVSLLTARARTFYLSDRNCPISWEPSGEDFLSPCLAEADLMRRVLPSDEFAAWLRAFLPDVSTVEPLSTADPNDGKLAHLAGLNLSRAWMLRAIGYEELAEPHAEAGLRYVTSDQYEIAHWLGTFAVYLLCP